jgi:hypothetical protein
MQSSISDLKAEALFFKCLHASIPKHKDSSNEIEQGFDGSRQQVFFTCVQLGLRAQDLAYKAFVAVVQEQKKKG